MTDDELIQALRRRLPNEVRASDLVSIVHEYADESALLHYRATRRVRQLAEREKRDGGLLDPADILRALDEPRSPE